MKLEETSGGHVFPPEKLMAIQGESCLASADVFLCENGQLRWLFTISDFAQFSLKCIFSSLISLIGGFLCLETLDSVFSCLVRSS